MKGSHLYLLLLGAALVLVFLFEYLGPRKFSWRETYDKYDKDPFGSYVFHDVLSSSVDSFSVINQTFYQIFQEDSTASPRSFLLTENRPSFTEIDIDYMLRLIRAGNRIMICTSHVPHLLEEKLNLKTSSGSYRPNIYTNIYIYIKERRARDKIFLGIDTLCPERIYEVYPQIHPSYIELGVKRWVDPKQPETDTLPAEAGDPASGDPGGNDSGTGDSVSDNSEVGDSEVGNSTGDDPAGDDSEVDDSEVDDSTGDDPEAGSSAANDSTGDDPEETVAAVDPNLLWKFFPVKCDSFRILAWNEQNKPLAVRLFIGKGEFYFVATPLMFTNYGILDGDNASYTFGLLSYVKELPLVRIETYGTYGDKQRTPLRYILSVPALRWAIYATLILLVLFMISAAGRRQRIIPVIKSPPNRSLGFMQLISNLYFQRHDNGEILTMKYRYFCTEVNRLTALDFRERMPDDSDYQRLSEKTGKEKETLKTLLRNIQIAVYRSDVDDARLKQYIDGMNDILHAMYT